MKYLTYNEIIGKHKPTGDVRRRCPGLIFVSKAVESSQTR